MPNEDAFIKLSSDIFENNTANLPVLVATLLISEPALSDYLRDSGLYPIHLGPELVHQTTHMVPGECYTVTRNCLLGGYHMKRPTILLSPFPMYQNSFQQLMARLRGWPEQVGAIALGFNRDMNLWDRRTVEADGVIRRVLYSNTPECEIQDDTMFNGPTYGSLFR